MSIREQERRAAAIRHDLDRAAAAILRRGGDPELVWQELWAAIKGRYNLVEKQAAAPPCANPEHRFIKPLGSGPCPLCIPTGD